MSTETLTRAAAKIREEWGDSRGGAWSQVQAFHLAVADWLDSEASRVNFGWELGETPKVSPAALAVAHTHLGESA